MLKVKDLSLAINTNTTKVIYEDHWNGRKYNYVDEDARVEQILPVDEKTIKISVTV